LVDYFVSEQIDFGGGVWMSFKLLLGVGVACGVVSVPAQAAKFVLSAQGTVSDLHSSESPSISGAFNKGDAYSLGVVADLDAASLWFSSADKATAFYNVPVAYNFTSGSFNFSGSSIQTLSITNNTTCSGYCTAADSAYFLSLGFSQVSGMPSFDLGAGSYYQSLSIQFFDITGAAFNGTGLDQLSKINSFRSPTFSYQLTQVDTPSKAAFATFTNTSYNVGVTGVVPEPTTWLTMILGMGAIGFAMRRRQKVTTRETFAF
jgi:hypothetical protein